MSVSIQTQEVLQGASTCPLVRRQASLVLLKLLQALQTGSFPSGKLTVMLKGGLEGAGGAKIRATESRNSNRR